MNKQIKIFITIVLSLQNMPFVNAMELHNLDFASFGQELTILLYATDVEEEADENIEDQTKPLFISLQEALSKENIAQLRDRMISWYAWGKQKWAQNQDDAEEEMFYIFLPTWFMR